MLLHLIVVGNHVCMEDVDKNYMLTWPVTKAGETHYDTKQLQCVEGITMYVCVVSSRICCTCSAIKIIISTPTGCIICNF